MLSSVIRSFLSSHDSRPSGTDTRCIISGARQVPLGEVHDLVLDKGKHPWHIKCLMTNMWSSFPEPEGGNPLCFCFIRLLCLKCTFLFLNFLIILASLLITNFRLK
ncbi:uncharacterized protein LOC113754220 isoform X2 [Coffea eugenioides]|uniref:uncharacterized protein LOC113754220 isoform X2 n=1 Tax=Coffea eugenioides TaxID=49369 RepID=UPI000F60ED7C|nr:uncharacterized protein LOC113754220 isoform X2 [Coffea eugenioides]